MTIYFSTLAKPYVYICIHKETREFYIGYRERNVSLRRPSTVDLPLYKTSSKLVRPQFEEFEWIIVAEFNTGDAAYEFEQQLIRENWDDPLLLNEQYRLPSKEVAFKSKKGINRGRKNPALSLRNKTTVPWNKGLTKEDPRIAAGVRTHTEAGKQLRSEIMKEWHKHNSVAGKNNPMYGVKRGQAPCEHCGKMVDIANYTRWHGERCKARI